MTTPDLNSWVSIATQKLVPDAVERIRTEIGDHYNSAVASGKTAEQALATLGDPKRANREYRRALLTTREAVILKTLRGAEGFQVPLALPVTLFGIGLALLVAAFFLGTQGAVQKAQGLVVLAWLFVGIVYPLHYTQPKLVQRRCLFYSFCMAVLLLQAMQFTFGEPYWGFIKLVPYLWIERTIITMRRKVPREAWPRALSR